MRFNPPGDQLVGLQSWLWVDTPWAPAEASASVSGVTATVTATPEVVVWDTGDGHVVTCRDPGSRYDTTEPPAPRSSTCGHVYTWPSSTQPSGVYRVTATVTYAAAWHASDGTGDDLGPVTRATTVPLRVVEVQAVVDD